MIVVPEDSSLRFITQPDHAHFSGELLSLWRAGGLAAHPRRDDLIFAAREHDNGWREADAAPRWDADRGRPHDFLTLPREDRIEIWQRGACRFAAERPYAALLITRHAVNLFGSRRREEGWSSFVAFLDDFAHGLLEETGVTRQALEDDYRLIDLADQISLAACSNWQEPVERYGIRIEPRNGEIALDPCPLAGATSFKVPCRRIPRRVYRGDADLGGELAAARWEDLRLRVAERGREA
ncbi:MAG TPA: DUF3891 family protein [Thermoanaerobaculia bacterium]|nr:DUF3891 family protein [Thermoanaerobaculia bacterium]